MKLANKLQCQVLRAKRVILAPTKSAVVLELKRKRERSNLCSSLKQFEETDESGGGGRE